MSAYLHLLPEVLAQAALSLLFFALLLASGILVGGKSLGTPARAAVVPLMVVPIAEDWIRYLSHCSFRLAWLLALVGWIVLVAVVLATRRTISLPRQLHFKRWLAALAFAFVFHAVIRMWILTGSFPVPADDVFGGFKANALVNSIGWPTTHPEIPELGFNYYYYAYTWAAGMACWLNVSLWAAWWATALVLCATGTLLVLEIWLPFLRHKRATALATLAAIGGGSLMLPLDLLLRHPPKVWGFVPDHLLPHLYLQFPTQNHAIWSPFSMLCCGLLLSAIWMILNGWRRPLTLAQQGYVILVLGSLAGYCTFFLLGFILVILPALAVIALIRLPWNRWPGLIGSLALWGILAAMASWPFLSEILHRSTEERNSDFNPLLPWLVHHHDSGELGRVIFFIVLFSLLLNPLGFWASWRFPARGTILPFLRLVFLWGCFVCLWGITNDFVAKMGTFIGLAGLTLFIFQADPRSKWTRRLGALCLVGPGLICLNGVRANLMLPKMDPVWQTLDREALPARLPVYYTFPGMSVEDRDVWPYVYPFFSRARFIVPPNEIDATSLNFLPNVNDLKKLPQWRERVHSFAPGDGTYLLLQPTMPGLIVPEDSVLYRSKLYTLTLEKLPPK
jgi:hypothetical protein